MGLPSPATSVITGAGSGFGRALALELARRGGRLVLGDVIPETALETAQLARAEGAAHVRAMSCDVTSLGDVEALAGACEGRVDLVVNNAGVSSAGNIGELPPDDWRWTLDVDLNGVFHGCHVFVPLLRRQGTGHILNVASAAGFASAPGMGAYNVAKAGVIALSETLAAELHGTAIGVTVLCPTFFKTNIVASGRFADPKKRAAAAKLIAAGKTAEEVARYALHSVEKGELYSVPMADARWLWRVKRASPASFAALAARVAQRFNR